MKKLQNFKMVGLDGNAFMLMGAFSAQAKKEGWSKPEIEEVMVKARSGDYNNLLSTLLDHCENPLGNDDEDFDDEDFDDEEEE
jgi:hypothetical protein